LETLALPRRYATVLAPSSVLQLIPDSERVGMAVRRIRDHLLPGGALIAPFMTLWREGMPLQREWEAVHVRERDGALLQRMGRIWYDPTTACESTEDLYQVVVDEVCVAAEHHRRSPATRSYTQVQARQLLREGGFTHIEIMRGFSHSAADEQDDFYTLIARTPQEDDYRDIR
jgi:hypothetical protein